MKIIKRPQVIQDLIELATYLAEDSLDVSERFLFAAEKTFQKLSQFPQRGKISNFTAPQLANIRQQAIEGFRKYLIFYRCTNSEVEIIRVIHGARDLEAILEKSLEED
ncbi:MAG: type II toxin-antitoxin system RelE/ParE family toxin [Xenococcus sp. (in: cyanobacteria)]